MIEYESGKLGYSNENKYFSCDKCKIVSIGNKSIWLLIIIVNETKNFRIEHTIESGTYSLKAFSIKHIERVNHIVIGGWNGYDFLDSPNSGYLQPRYIQGGGDFDYRRESSSDIEAIWAQFNAKFLTIYHSILSQYFLPFIREIEFKIKNNKLNLEEKILNFFECYDTSNSVSDNEYENGDILFMHNLGFIHNANEGDSDSDND